MKQLFAGLRIVISCGLAFSTFEIAWAELVPPRIIYPEEAAVLDPPEGNDPVTLVWAWVEDATGYWVTVDGPEGFTDLRNTFVEPATGVVSFFVNNVILGEYAWSVNSAATSEIAVGATRTFTVELPDPGGGGTPPPSLVQPYDYAILRGQGGEITFQWRTVPRAATYEVNVSSFGDAGGFIDVDDFSEGFGFAQRTFKFPIGNSSRLFEWSVTPISATGERGMESDRRSFLFTPEDLESPDLPFAVETRWKEGTTVLDLDSDGATDERDLLALVPFQRSGKVFSVDAIGPNLFGPADGASVSRQDITFVWIPVTEAVAYELNVLNSNGRFVSTVFVPEPDPNASSIDVVVPFLSAGEYTWRVRAFFGTGATASGYSERSLTTISGAR